MKLEHLVTYRADLKPAVNIGAGPVGNRQIYDVTGGAFEGPKLKGKVLPSGGDWAVIGPDNALRLDVRATFETDDGATIYVQYYGVLSPLDAVIAKSARGEPSDFGDFYFMTVPRFETGDPRYAWLNTMVAVGEGRSGPGWVEYRVYQVVN